MSPRRAAEPVAPAIPATPRKPRSTRATAQRLSKSSRDAVMASAASFGVGAENDTEQLPPPTVARLWQEEAWTYFELVPEFQYAAGFYGSCFSRVSLVPAFENEDGEVSTTFDDEAPASNNDPTAPAAAEEINEFISQLRPMTGGQPAFMRAIGVNFGVTGECYSVRKAGLDAPGPWDVLSVNELRPNTGPENTRRKAGKATDVTWMHWRGPGYLPERLGPEAYIVRLWQPHPRYGMQPHSAVKACLPHLENLVLLDREMRGTTVSRLASAGLLLLSDEIDYPSDEDAPEGSEGDDPLTRDLIAAAAQAISDKSSAAGTIPIVLRASTEAIERGVKYVSFAKIDDAVSMAKRRELVERFAQGYDLPPEQIYGKAESTFSNAFAITEDLFRAHVEPKLVNVVDGLTAGALHPWLRLRHGIGEDQALPSELARRRIHYNASRLVSHPDRSKEATEGRKMFALSDTAWRRANGFTEDDAPSPDELAVMINTVRQTNVKETIRGEDVNVPPITDPNLLRPEVQPGAPDRHDQDAALTASITPIGVLAVRLHSAADATVERAVERANARLRSLANRDADLVARLRGTAKEATASVLGPDKVHQLAKSLGELFSGEFGAFARRALAWAREHGCSDPEGLAHAVTEEVERLARKRLYDPDVAVGMETFARLVATAGFVDVAAVPAPAPELSDAR